MDDVHLEVRFIEPVAAQVIERISKLLAAALREENDIGILSLTIRAADPPLQSSEEIDAQKPWTPTVVVSVVCTKASVAAVKEALEPKFCRCVPNPEPHLKSVP